MKAVFLDLARTTVDFRPGYHNEIGSFLRSNGYCISDRDVFREIAKQRAWLHISPDCSGSAALDFISLFEELTGDMPDRQTIEGLKSVGVPAQTCELYDDVPLFIERARAYGLKVVLIASSQDYHMNIVSGTGIENLVDGVAYGSYAGYPRRGSCVFQTAEKIAGSKGVFIGDTYEVDSVDAREAELPFILVDREDYYSDVRRNKTTSLETAIEKVLDSQLDEEMASGSEWNNYPSPLDLFAGWKPQEVWPGGQRMPVLNHRLESCSRRNTRMTARLQLAL